MRAFGKILLVLIYSAAMIATGVAFGLKALALLIVACCCTAFAVGVIYDDLDKDDLEELEEDEIDEPNDGSDDEC